MAYENEIPMFSEQLARRISYTNRPRLGVKQLVRSWKASTDVHRATALEYVNAYVSAANANPSKTISNPQADSHGTTAAGTGKNIYSGTWRHVGTDWDGRIESFVQTLRYGFATTLLVSSKPNDECRILTAADQRTDSRILTLFWHSISDAAVKACMDELRTAGTFTNPVIQGVTHTGTWAIDTITPQQAEDGSYTLQVTTIKTVTVATSANLTSPIREYIRDINNPFGITGGFTAGTVGRNRTFGITLTYRALSTSSRSVLETLSESSLLGLLDEAEQGSYKPVKAIVQEDAGNTLKFVVAFQYVPLATTAPESAARYVSFGLSNQSGKLTLRRRWVRMDPTAVQAIIQGTDASPNIKITAKTVTDPKADDKTYSGTYFARLTQGAMTENDGCSLDQELTLAGDADVDVYQGDGPDVGSYTKYLYDASETAVKAFLMATTFPDSTPPGLRPAGWAAINPAWNTSEEGVTKAHKITHNADGSLNLWAFYASSKNLSHIEFNTSPIVVGESNFESSTIAHGWNVSSASLAAIHATYAAQEANKEKDFKITRRDGHTFDFVGIVKTHIKEDSGDVVEVWTAGEKRIRRKGKKLSRADVLTDFADPISKADGTVVEVKKDLNKLGTTDAEKVTTIKIKVETPAHVAKDTADGTVTEKRGENLTDAEVKAGYNTAKAAGQYAEREIKRDPVSGLNAAVERVFVEEDQEFGGGKSSAVEDEVIVGHTASASAAGASGGAPNVIVEAENVRTPGGRYKSRHRTITKKEIDSGQILAEVGPITQTSRQVLLNQTVIPPAGVGEQVKFQANGAGAWDVEKIKKELRNGHSVKTWESETVANHDPKAWQEKVPVRSGTTITGYLIYIFTAERTQTGRITTTRTFSLTMPSATAASNATASPDGSGTSYKNRIVQLDADLWCEEKIVITTGAWSSMQSQVHLVGTLSP